MALSNIHTYLVHPHDKGEQTDGTAVPLQGQLFELLRDVYEKSDSECDIDIAFNPNAEGAQDNAIRSQVLAYLEAPNLETGKAIADALRLVTTNRSGVGMLFLMSGREDDDHKIVVSRFPANKGILAEEAQDGLSVEFLERVFMKSQYAYKAATFRGPTLAAGFWQGRAVDKQLGDPLLRVSDYWVKGFLDSEFKTTSAGGTRRLAEALRKASQATNDPDVRREIIAAATLAGNLADQQTSIDGFSQQFRLSDAAKGAITRQLKNPATAQEQFIFAADEFHRQIAYRSVELNSGAILTAQAADFDRVFQREDLDAGLVRFSTLGVPVDERLRKVSA
ncbi:MAG: hypothetical protein E7812_14330 [Phenylobacterium sp.]|nr:MAG: hypothetical protein E7812_14330 [Phenylobacterium sp.]